MPTIGLNVGWMKGMVLWRTPSNLASGFWFNMQRGTLKMKKKTGIVGGEWEGDKSSQFRGRCMVK